MSLLFATEPRCDPIPCTRCPRSWIFPDRGDISDPPLLHSLLFGRCLLCAKLFSLAFSALLLLDLRKTFGEVDPIFLQSFDGSFAGVAQLSDLRYCFVEIF